MSSQPEEGEILETSIPPVYEEPASPAIPQRQKRIKIRMNKGQRVCKRLVPNPSIPKTIPKEETNEEEIESEEEEDQVPIKRRTWLAKAIELERRKSAMSTPSPTQEEPVELSSSEDEV